MFKYEVTTQIESIDMGIRMIGFHAPMGFMQVETCLEGERHFVQGKGSGCITLADYLERNALSDQQFSELLLGLVRPLQDMARFYIDGRYIEYAADRIFYSYDTKSCAYVYGSALCSDAKEAVQGLIREIIYERARLIKPNSEFVSKILGYLKEPGWHLKGLEYILEKQAGVDKRSQEHAQEQEESQWEFEHERVQEVVKEKSAKQPRQVFAKPASKIGSKVNIKAMSKSKKSSHDDQTGSKRKNSLVMIGTLAVLGVLFNLPIDTDFKMGGSIIFLALLYYVHYRNTQNKSTQKSDESSKQTGDIKAQAVSHQNISVKKRYVKAAEQKPVERHEADTQRTVMANKSNYAQALIDADGVIIPLKQRRHIIGRLKNHADILIRNDDTVGRQHAELIKLEMGYAVKDLNSVNGTYVNHTKVLPDQPIVLREGDVLSISETHFKYSC